jgi:hypothetical protein
MVQLVTALTIQNLRRVSRIKWSHCFLYITAGQSLHCFDSEHSRSMDSSFVPLAWFPGGTSFTQSPSVSSNINNYVSSTWSLLRNTYWLLWNVPCGARLVCGARPKCSTTVATLINICCFVKDGAGTWM